MSLRYSRILLKLSGELFMSGTASVDTRAVDAVAEEIAGLAKKKISVGVVVGGGNIMRGRIVKAPGWPCHRLCGSVES